MKKVGVTYHPKSEAARAVAQEIRSRLNAIVPDVWFASAWDDEAREDHVPGTELVICCGGDGTVLRAARAVVPHEVVILGVNLGRIGFLTEMTAVEALNRLEEVVGGAGRVESRAMLEAERRRDGSTSERYHALNDVVVGRSTLGRTVQFAVRTDGTTAGSYRADGVIVATATGSTAYSLSVGGPILHPEARDIVVTPVAPHLAPANSIVLRPGAVIEVEIAERQAATLSVDGQPDEELAGGDVVRVQASRHQARFLRFGPPDQFYVRVGRRLNWLQE
ncbi:MAG TPA: NAD(+)/NADH kinase [Dehalococcoidia bacterium]|nr:NAD(+)/NADH kinase [Dehalococcoidia bacterium]